MQRTFPALVLVLFCAFMLLPMPAAATQVSSGTNQVQPQATATPAPQATAQSGQRRRLEAPPLAPQVAGLLIGINLLIAAGIVLLAFVMRRRKQRR
ncbi:MAG: hypothetical protein H7Z42_22700 [Roseiflexaceae bacterium]|nr:hypothetical protein [Roseiflexaceae bacterium]